MQANKATPEMLAQLRQWLENPHASPHGAAAEGARYDLSWLNAQRDLSSVKLGAPDAKGAEATKEKIESESSAEEKRKTSTAGGGGGGGGFASLFGCAGRRK
jgi:hypothetical protein